MKRTMQVSMPMDTSSAASPTTTSASTLVPAPSLSPLPPTQSQAGREMHSQSSPAQKRSVQDFEMPDAIVPSDCGNNLNQTSTSTLTYVDDKENRDSSLALKSAYPPTMTTSVPVSVCMPPPAGTDGLTTPNVNVAQVQPQTGNVGLGTPPAAKKRKLSPASREAKQQEKEVKERQKLEEKAKKEAEKAKKEEEKRKRDAEKEEERKKREEKKKVKEEEKAAKEEERKKKEEEKLKKARAQTRLNSFFVKPKAPTEHSLSNSGSSPKKPSSDGAHAESPRNVGKASDYQRAFPDFFLQSHTHLAPPHRFERDAQALVHLQAKVDSYLTAAKTETEFAETLVFRPSELFRLIPYKRRRGHQPMSVRDILLQMQSFNEVPETSEASIPEAVRKLQSSLNQVKMKSLKFGEDVRPPYLGTYTKKVPLSTSSRLMRNPFCRELPDTNYDYDSEAEWEDPGEGEDLDSEEEDEGSEEGDEDMEGFLDDEEDLLADGKRRLLVGELEPVCTGIRWQDEEQGPDPELQIYKIETILPSVTFPIDPFSSSYWPKPKALESGPVNWTRPKTLHSFMGNPVPPTSGCLSLPEETTLAAGKPLMRAFPVEQLGDFKAAVEGSDLTKTGLIEVLKKRFPKVSKGTLKATLDSLAIRVGQKEADKKWVCK